MAIIDGRTLDHNTLEHIRIQAVRRVIEDGESPGEVMRGYGFCRTTIYPWLRDFKDKGWEALAESIHQGPEPKMTEKQKQQVARWILGKDPRQYGFDFGLWSRRIVQLLIREKMGLEFCLTSVGKLLASLNITPRKPLRRAYERDPAAVARWEKETYPQLKRRAKRLGAKLFFSDEAGFQSDPVLGRTYGRKGQPPVVTTSGQRPSLNVISTVNARGEFWAGTYTGKLNAESFVLCLRDFMKSQTGKIFLVVDGHPAHKANAVKNYIQSLRGRLELHFLPPDAPDLNPDEFVWSYMKNNGVSKKPLKKSESLQSRIDQDLNGIKDNRKLVQSFVQAKSVAYTND
jgi:transposase